MINNDKWYEFVNKFELDTCRGCIGGDLCNDCYEELTTEDLDTLSPLGLVNLIVLFNIYVGRAFGSTTYEGLEREVLDGLIEAQEYRETTGLDNALKEDVRKAIRYV